MKKLLILILAMMLLLLSSCAGDDDGGASDGGGGSADGDSTEGGGETEAPPVDYGTATVYVPGDEVQIIAGDAYCASATSRLAEELGKVIITADGKGEVAVTSIYATEKKYEVIFNYVDEARPATVKARKLLERMDKDSYFMGRAVVYAESGCIAVAYDENEYSTLQSVSLIIEEFISKYISGKEYLALGEGIILTATYDLIELQEEIDIAIEAAEWIALEEEVGADIANALRQLYELYTDDIVEWSANLYDPGIGGYYASSSGRNGDAFGPDVQCTRQTMNFITQSGMIKYTGDTLPNLLPEAMKQQMIYFAKSLQDTNGYFYHPQWGKAATDTHLSRRGRDLGWAKDILVALGSRPTYDTPNGYKGDGITADEYWESLGTDAPKPYSYDESPYNSRGEIIYPDTVTSSVTQSAAAAVSMVIATDSSTAYLESHKGFMDYLLNSIDPGMRSNPYNMGNNLNATSGQIGTASKKLGVYTYTTADDAKYQRFDGMTLKEMLISVLNDCINPKTGLWGDLTAEKPLGTEFRYTNGFFKVLPIYNGWGIAYPAEYISMAADALMDGLLGDEPSKSNICDVFNVWSAINTLKSNLNYIEDRELAATITDTVDNILTTKAAYAITNSYNKILGYKKPDGGFAHVYTKGTVNHQGLPVSTGINESDVDATCIGTTGLTREMFEALGISELKPCLYYEADWMHYVDILLKQQPVIKYAPDYDSEQIEIHTYEEDIPGPSYMRYNTGIEANTFTQLTLPDKGGVGYLKKQEAGKQSYFDWYVNSSASISNVASFSTDIKFDNIVAASEPVEFRFYDGSDSTNRIYTLYFYVKDGAVKLAPKTDSSTTKRIEVAKVGEWFNIDIVYFEASETTPERFKVYINGSETPVIVDEAFENGSDVVSNNVRFSRLLTMANFKGDMYLDNTKFVHEQRTYVPDESTHNKGKASVVKEPTLPTTNAGSNTTVTSDGAMTFDNITAFPVFAENGIVLYDKQQSDKWYGGMTIATEGDNSFLRITDPHLKGMDAGQCILLFDRPAYTGDSNTFVFEAKFRISALEDGSLNSTYAMLDLTFRNTAEKRVYRTYFGGGKIGLNNVNVGKNAADGGYSNGEWFTLKVEYTVIGDELDNSTYDVKAYINGNLVTESTEVSEHIFCDSKHIDKVGILLSMDYVGYLDIDNVKMYQK